MSEELTIRAVPQASLDATIELLAEYDSDKAFDSSADAGEFLAALVEAVRPLVSQPEPKVIPEDKPPVEFHRLPGLDTPGRSWTE